MQIFVPLTEKRLTTLAYSGRSKNDPCNPMHENRASWGACGNRTHLEKRAEIARMLGAHLSPLVLCSFFYIPSYPSPCIHWPLSPSFYPYSQRRATTASARHGETQDWRGIAVSIAKIVGKSVMILGTMEKRQDNMPLCYKYSHLLTSGNTGLERVTEGE